MSRGTLLAAVLMLGCQAVEEDTQEVVGFEGCPSYSGLHTEGAWWRYEPHAELPLDQDWKSTLTSAESVDDGVVVTVEAHVQERGFDMDQTQVRTVQYRCDDEGLWLLSELVEYSQVFDRGLEEGWYRYDYDQPQLLLTADVAPGDRWSSDWHWTSETHHGSAGEARGTTTTDVIGPRGIEVPAGSYEALGFARTMGSMTLPPDWMTREAGVVIDAFHGTELIGFGR